MSVLHSSRNPALPILEKASAELAQVAADHRCLVEQHEQAVVVMAGQRDRIQSLEEDAAGRESKLVARVTQLESAAEVSGDALSSLEQQYSDACQLAEQRRHDFDQMKAKMAEVSESSQRLGHELDEKTALCAGLTEQLSALQHSEQLHKQLEAQLQQQVTELQASAAEHFSTEKELLSTQGDLNAALEQMRQRAVADQEHRETMETAMATLRARLEEVTQSAADSASSADALSNELDGCREQLREKEAARTRLGEKLRAVEDDLEAKTRSADEQRRALDAELSSSKQRLTELEESLCQASERNVALTKSNEQLVSGRESASSHCPGAERKEFQTQRGPGVGSSKCRQIAREARRAGGTEL